MSKTPKVSVIVAVYKAEAYLDKCIQSIVDQTFKECEVILVDDGSPDNCPAICDTFAAKHSNISVIHQKNAGQTVARQAGLQRAKGKYVLLVDSDDWLEPTMLETLYDKAVSEKADIVTCNMYFHTNGHRQKVDQPVPKGTFNQEGLTEHIYPQMLYSGRFFYFGIAAAMWNKLFKKSILVPNIMNIDKRVMIGEDGLSTYGSFLDAKKICIIDDPLYNYRNDNASITRTYTEEQFTNAKRLIAELRKLNKQKKRFDLSSQIDYYYMYNIWSIFEEEFRFKTSRTFKEKYTYLSRIAHDTDVLKTVERVSTATMRRRHKRFLWLLARRQVTLLIITTMASVKIRRFLTSLYRLIR